MRFTVFAFLVASSSALAQPDPIKDKLDEAKASYTLADASLRKSVRELFDKADAAASDRGDTKKVILIDEERKLFDRGDPWEFKSIDVGRLKARRDAAWKDMSAAYKDASVAYTKARKKTQARDVEAEKDAFEKAETDRLGRAADRASDTIKAGTRWRGDRTLDDGRVTDFELIVESRDGDRFKGRSIVGGTNFHRVEGTIGNGKIEWKIVEVLDGGGPGQGHSGHIKDDVIYTKFDGPGTAGQRRVGTAELKLQR